MLESGSFAAKTALGAEVRLSPHFMTSATKIFEGSQYCSFLLVALYRI